SVVAGSRVVIVRSLGGLDYWRYGFERLADVCRENAIELVALPGDDRPDARLAALATVTPEDLALFDAYFRHGGPSNAANALRLAAALARSEPCDAPAPAELGAAILVTSDGTVTDIDAWKRGTRASAFVTFYRANLLASDMAPVLAMMRQLEAEGL